MEGWEGHGNGKVRTQEKWELYRRGGVGVGNCASEEVAASSCPPQIRGTFTTVSPVGGSTSTTKTLVRVCLRPHRAPWHPTGEPGGG